VEPIAAGCYCIIMTPLTYSIHSNVWFMPFFKTNTSFLLTNFKIACGKSRTGEQPREDHINRNSHTTRHISFANLYVLYFCGWNMEKKGLWVSF
jgi:hypothetical protein